MIIQFKTYFILLLIVPSLYVKQLTAAEITTKKQLKVLTWNIYSLPFVINTSNRIERAKGVVEVLQQSDYDVIVFQETFHKKSFQIIERGLKATFPYHIKVERKVGFLKHHHGIFMVSKYPFELLGTIAFKHCKGSDCLSRKGAILIELEKDRQMFQVLGTHLQSGIKISKERIRKKQRQQLTAFLKVHRKTNIPQLLCGDFNTDFNNIQRRNDMLNDLEITQVNIPYERTWPHTYYSTKKKESHIIDYIFVKRNGFKFRSTISKVHNFFAMKKKMALSDHSAVELELHW